MREPADRIIAARQRAIGGMRDLLATPERDPPPGDVPERPPRPAG